MSASVPGREGSGEADRGNISYQALKRAFSRSTRTRNVSEVAAGAGSGQRPTASTRGAQAASSRPVAVLPPAAAAAAWRRRLAHSPSETASSPCASIAAAATMSDPTRNSTSTGCPASAFADRSWRQVPNQSTVARMQNRCAPNRSGTNSAVQTSLSMHTMGAVLHSSSSSCRKRSVHATWSWPSVKTSAVTTTGSPRLPFAG